MSITRVQAPLALSHSGFRSPSRKRLINPIPLFWRLQPIRRDLLWHLPLLRPLSDGIEVPALMPRVKVDVGGWRGGVEPYLAQDADVDGAHELLAEDVEAVGLIGGEDC